MGQKSGKEKSLILIVYWMENTFKPYPGQARTKQVVV
jgi:hypothetical protein